MSTSSIHTIEHFLARFMRENIEHIIEISPMGYGTGFYIVYWEEVELDKVMEALEYSFKKVIDEE
jgi:S-ribosylhomocysteine lyase